MYKHHTDALAQENAVWQLCLWLFCRWYKARRGFLNFEIDRKEQKRARKKWRKLKGLEGVKEAKTLHSYAES